MKNSARLSFAKLIVAALFVAGTFNLSHAAAPGGNGINLPGEFDRSIKTEMTPGGNGINLPGEFDRGVRTEMTPGGNGINLPGEFDSTVKTSLTPGNGIVLPGELD